MMVQKFSKVTKMSVRWLEERIIKKQNLLKKKYEISFIIY